MIQLFTILKIKDIFFRISILILDYNQNILDFQGRKNDAFHRKSIQQIIQPQKLSCDWDKMNKETIQYYKK